MRKGRALSHLLGRAARLFAVPLPECAWRKRGLLADNISAAMLRHQGEGLSSRLCVLWVVVRHDAGPIIIAQLREQCRIISGTHEILEPHPNTIIAEQKSFRLKRCIKKASQGLGLLLGCGFGKRPAKQRRLLGDAQLFKHIGDG